AGAISTMTGAGILPIRKAGKLPRPAAAVSYTLEYGTATIEGPDVLKEGERVLLIDDILATGGTLTAAQALVRDLGAEVVGSAVVLELTALGGREHTGEVHTLFAE
ncbi:MAG TPA: adenine phosphoribosyltransferase, partial [Brevibacterium sp.]|nr:adenine phosphoribosyltransferase [Brevibacterium sp.]